MFLIVLKTVMMMLIYVLIGFVLVKSGLGVSAHAKSISSFLVYICGPCIVLNAFFKMTFDGAANVKMAQFFVATLATQALFFLITYLIFKNKMQDSKYRIMSIGGVLGNVGFFGIPLVTSLFPGEPIVACYSSIYMISMNLIVFTIGVFMITRKKEYISLKGILVNPTSISFLLAMPFYITGFRLPETFNNGVSLLGQMSTPICMLILGMRLASVNLKKLFIRPFAYASALLKLLVYPAFAYGCVYFLPWFDNTFKLCVLALSSAPTAAIVLSMAEIHECEQELSANVVLLATILSIITAPLLILIFT